MASSSRRPATVLQVPLDDHTTPAIDERKSFLKDLDGLQQQVLDKDSTLTKVRTESAAAQMRLESKVSELQSLLKAAESQVELHRNQVIEANTRALQEQNVAATQQQRDIASKIETIKNLRSQVKSLKQSKKADRKELQETMSKLISELKMAQEEKSYLQNRQADFMEEIKILETQVKSCQDESVEWRRASAVSIKEQRSAYHALENNYGTLLIAFENLSMTAEDVQQKSKIVRHVATDTEEIESASRVERQKEFQELVDAQAKSVALIENQAKTIDQLLETKMKNQNVIDASERDNTSLRERLEKTDRQNQMLLEKERIFKQELQQVKEKFRRQLQKSSEELELTKAHMKKYISDSQREKMELVTRNKEQAFTIHQLTIMGDENERNDREELQQRRRPDVSATLEFDNDLLVVDKHDDLSFESFRKSLSASRGPVTNTADLSTFLDESHDTTL